MAATAGRVAEVEEDQEALFSTYPSASYYVQSPSATSQANGQRNRETPTSPHTLSRYSSSICSSNSFLHGKKNIVYDLHLSDGDGVVKKGRNRLVIVTGGGGEERKSSGLWRFLSLDPSSSWCYIGAQVTCRFLMSLGVALLVFYLATRPPTPIVSVEVTGIQQFELAEGIDVTDVPTKVLTCNCSVDEKIENHSNVFGLHSHPPTIDIIFGRMRIAISQDHEAYAEADWLVYFQNARWHKG